MDHRRNPRELLKYVQREERSQSRGKLKIFLGAAPGVGKTYTMLEEAIVRRNEKIDVVVGIVETHGRKETEAFLEKLEVLPRGKIIYRDKEFHEFDLDGALARRPELILVDEMAHANVPGSRHNKRWQDIMELLDRGINVYTTMNVQHVESLNNIITQITGIVVRETVPDTLLEEASAIELIDLPPDDLLKRLEEGKIYVPSDVGMAIENFFRKGNLSALRELALRVTAEQVDVELLSHRQGESIEKIVPARERLLVCVGPGPNSPRLIRAAYRIAKNLHAKWIAVSIETPRLQAVEEDRQKVIKHLRLAEQLGGETRLIGGEDIVTEIMDLAHDLNVTKIILGKKNRSRWKNIFSRSLADELVRQSIDIDLFILRGDAEKGSVFKTSWSAIQAPKISYLTGFLTVAFCTVIDFFLSPYLESNTLVMIFFLGIIFVARLGFFWPAFFTSLLSVLSFGFFFAPPRFSFTLTDTQYIITFSVMLVVSQIIAHLTLLTKQQAEFTRLRDRRIATINQLNKQLARTRGVEKLLDISVQHLCEAFNCEAQVFLPNNENKLVAMGVNTMEGGITDKEQSVIQWVYELGQLAGRGTQTLPENRAIYVPLVGTNSTIGVLRILPKNGDGLFSPEQLDSLEGFAHQMGVALEVDKLQEEAKKTELQMETDRVRNVVMKYISDTMHAPLQELMGSVNELSDMARELNLPVIENFSNKIYNNSTEINHLINNLSQIARLENSQITLTKKPHSLYRVVTIALKSLNRRLEKRPIIVNVSESFPKIPFNKVFLEHVFFNIIENAIKYTPPNAAIEISAYLEPQQVLISIEDQGPGLAIEDIKQIFIKFYRGHSKTNIKGMGLGLTICQHIIKMHGGDIWAENRPAGGAIFRFTLPLE
jgi:two-component system sensor histidine kinase KdpD